MIDAGKWGFIHHTSLTISASSLTILASSLTILAIVYSKSA